LSIENSERLRASLDKALDGVEGWLELPVAWQLHEIARRFPVSNEATKIVEIGTWKGRSTIALAKGLQAKGEGMVYGIDPHTGSEQTRLIYGELDTWNELLANLKAAGVEDCVVPIRSTAHAARPRFEDKSIHLLLIDGSREYNEFREYIEDWETTLTDGGILVFRGPFQPGVYRVVREGLLHRRSRFRKPIYIYERSGEMLMLEHHIDPPAWTFRDWVGLRVVATQYGARNSTRRLRRLVPSVFRRRAKSTLNGFLKLLSRAAPGATAASKRYGG